MAGIPEDNCIFWQIRLYGEWFSKRNSSNLGGSHSYHLQLPSYLPTEDLAFNVLNRFRARPAIFQRIYKWKDRKERESCEREDGDIQSDQTIRTREARSHETPCSVKLPWLGGQAYAGNWRSRASVRNLQSNREQKNQRLNWKAERLKTKTNERTWFDWRAHPKKAAKDWKVQWLSIWRVVR